MRIPNNLLARKPVRERLSLDPSWLFHAGDVPMPELREHLASYMNAKAGTAWGAAAPDTLMTGNGAGSTCRMIGSWRGHSSRRKTFPKATVRAASPGIGGSSFWQKTTEASREGKLLDEASVAGERNRTAAGPARAAVEMRLLALIEKLRADPCKKWTLTELATSCKLGRSQFSTLFVKLTGDTPVRFLNSLRIQQACRMLRETRLPVTRISLDCGFESSQYFARVFKQFTGGINAKSYRIGEHPWVADC